MKSLGLLQISLLSIVVLLVYSGLLTVSAVRCLSCSGLPHPFDCNVVSECGTHEQCSLTQKVRADGLVVYDMGCMSSMLCSANSGKRSGDFLTCLSCCDSDYCNMDGCSTTAPPLTQRGPKCMTCSAALHPEECRTVQTCNLDEVCGLSHNPHGSWVSRCMSKLQCAAIEKLSLNIPCALCCHGDFCNDRCRKVSAPVVGTTISPSRLLRCLHCDGVANPSDCKLVTSCVPEDACFVEKYVTNDGLIGFSSGCVPKQQCSTRKRFLQDGGRITICRECCHGNHCNVNGCGATVQSIATRGPICYQCPHMTDPYACHDVMSCGRDEVCSLRSMQGGDWSSGCLSKRHCDALLTISSHSVCCSTDFCNANNTVSP